MAELKTQIKLERFISVDSQSLERFEREGRRQGQQNLPPSNTTDLTKYESDEYNAVSVAWDAFQNEVVNTKKRIINKIEETHNLVENVFPAKEIEVEENLDSQLLKIETEVGPNSAAYSNNSDLLDNAKKDLAQIKKMLGNRELQINFERTYLPFMIALAFAEVWVNSKSFELFFASKQIISLLLATATGAMLVFFAHVTGSAIKRAVPDEMIGRRGKIIFSLLALNSLVAIFIFYLAKMRQAWVALDEAEGGPLLGLEVDGLENVLTDLDGFSSLFGAELGSEGLFLLLFNVIVYVAGLAGGFIRHDSHPDYENIINKERNLREEQVAFKKSYENGLSDAQKRRTDLITKIRSEKSAKDNDLKAFKRELNMIEKESENMKKAVTKSLNDKIQAFRRANKASRSEKAPSYFSIKLTLE